MRLVSVGFAPDGDPDTATIELSWTELELLKLFTDRTTPATVEDLGGDGRAFAALAGDMSAAYFKLCDDDPRWTKQSRGGRWTHGEG